MQQKTLVLGVIGSDVHAVGNRILDYAFTQAGFKVINIGVLATQEEFIHSAIETNADVLMVSSLYGHGEMDCRGLREKCQEKGIGNILMYVGGNLVVGKQDFESVKQRFLAMGFNRVYPPGTMPETPIRDLREDLGITED
ncbi:methylaspartate mutase subunit S [Desulfosporosinus sp. SB140]|uniref:methylaspartate mutase subunit S n=1 Tax=Desulfosporosinus paludis TaxID=3115649 RepID=UPI00388E2C0F